MQRSPADRLHSENFRGRRLKSIRAVRSSSLDAEPSFHSAAHLIAARERYFEAHPPGPEARSSATVHREARSSVIRHAQHLRLRDAVPTVDASAEHLRARSCQAARC